MVETVVSKASLHVKQPQTRLTYRRWDITELHGPAKWTYCYLYVILDIFRRYAPGGMVATHESAVLAEELIAADIHYGRAQAARANVLNRRLCRPP